MEELVRDKQRTGSQRREQTRRPGRSRNQASDRHGGSKIRRLIHSSARGMAQFGSPGMKKTPRLKTRATGVGRGAKTHPGGSPTPQIIGQRRRGGTPLVVGASHTRKELRLPLLPMRGGKGPRRLQRNQRLSETGQANGPEEKRWCCFPELDMAPSRNEGRPFKYASDGESKNRLLKKQKNSATGGHGSGS